MPNGTPCSFLCIYGAVSQKESIQLDVCCIAENHSPLLGDLSLLNKEVSERSKSEVQGQLD